MKSEITTGASTDWNKKEGNPSCDLEDCKSYRKWYYDCLELWDECYSCHYCKYRFLDAGSHYHPKEKVGRCEETQG